MPSFAVDRASDTYEHENSVGGTKFVRFERCLRRRGGRSSEDAVVEYDFGHAISSNLSNSLIREFRANVRTCLYD